jgi:hypothetical protein
MPRASQPGMARLLIRGGARKLIDLGADGLLELSDLATAREHQLGTHQPQQMQERRHGGTSGLCECGL